MSSADPNREQIRSSCRAVAPHRPEWSESTFSLIGVANTFTSWFSQPDAELHALLPNINQAALLYHTYWTEFEWYHSCFPRARFEDGLNAFYKRDPEAVLSEEAAELQWITMATLFAVARLAVMRVPNADATAKGLPLSTSDRVQKSAQWLRAGLSCLNRASTSLLESAVLALTPRAVRL